jgi:hypothetical protein
MNKHMDMSIAVYGIDLWNEIILWNQWSSIGILDFVSKFSVWFESWNWRSWITNYRDVVGRRVSYCVSKLLRGFQILLVTPLIMWFTALVTCSWFSQSLEVWTVSLIPRRFFTLFQNCPHFWDFHAFNWSRQIR